MKLILSIISAISILILFGPNSAFSQSDYIHNLETKYGIYIDEYISKLESKTVILRNTKPGKLRKQALLNCLKLDFLKTNKKDLTKILSAYRVRQQPYSIQNALNALFYNSVKRTLKTDSFYSCLQCGRKINLKVL